MNILFVCTGNTCRSPMAEGFASMMFANASVPINISSAGLYVIPGSIVSRFSVDALKEYNIDISGHIPSQLTDSMLHNADLVLTMTQQHKNSILSLSQKYANKVYTLGEYTHTEDVSDPYGCDYKQYQICANKINYAVLKLFERINPNE